MIAIAIKFTLLLITLVLPLITVKRRKKHTGLIPEDKVTTKGIAVNEFGELEFLDHMHLGD